MNICCLTRGNTLATILICILFVTGCGSNQNQETDLDSETEETDSILISDLYSNLTSSLLDAWYPKSVDGEDGGFLSSFNHDFSVGDDQRKMIVTQARHVWTNAKAHERFPQNQVYIDGAKHGFNFLKDKMWDEEYGGFHSLVGKNGEVISEGSEQKTAYVNSFGLYGLSAYYKAFKDPEALELAKKTFQWLEEKCHDPEYLGYFQDVSREGKVLERPENSPGTSTIGFKDQNSSIHLLEAFTELYQVWPDSLVKLRLKEMLLLIRDKMITDKGYLTLFFEPDWTPIYFGDQGLAVVEEHHYIDHVSFGHDVEIAYLMLEAEHILGEKDTKTLEVAKKVVDHAIDYGWDSEIGGFYDEGYYFPDSAQITMLRDTKNWWAQAEGLNSLLLMAKLFPDDPKEYQNKFKLQWEYIDKYIIDHTYGGWYDSGLDKDPQAKMRRKGHIWKGAYHNFRALDNCLKMLDNTMDLVKDDH